jgi:hypothetical protein
MFTIEIVGCRGSLRKSDGAMLGHRLYHFGPPPLSYPLKWRTAFAGETD